MLGRGGFDIYHLSFCFCTSARAAKSKLLRVIADTICEVSKQNLLLTSVSRRVFTRLGRPSHVSLSVSLKTFKTLDLLPTKGASLQKSCCDFHALLVLSELLSRQLNQCA